MCPDVSVGDTDEVVILQVLACDVVNHGMGVKLATGFGGEQIVVCIYIYIFGVHKAFSTVCAVG